MNNVKYSQKLIKNLNADIEKNFLNIYPIKKEYQITHSSISRMVMLDRYSQKDSKLVTLKPGDLVIGTLNPHQEFPTKVLGNVLEITKNNIRIKVDEAYVYATENKEEINFSPHLIEKPLEIYWEQIAKRVSMSLASVEKTHTGKKQCEKEFFQELASLNFIPAGRILYGAGSINRVTLFNCYVMPFIQDSRKGISEHRKAVMEIMSRGGGVGTNGSTLRPQGSLTKNVGGKSSGSVSWLNDISNLTNLIEMGGSRRGAQMMMLADWHPDIIQFIISKMQKPDILQVLKSQANSKIIRQKARDKIKNSAKQKEILQLCSYFLDNEDEFDNSFVGLAEKIQSQTTDFEVINPNYLKGANISVTITHDFMEAVEKDQDWELRFPDIENYSKEEKEAYDKEWAEIGDVREWEKMGYKIKTYHTIRARDLWELIVFCATFSAEPGVFFIDTANEYTNAQGYGQKIVATNPCGEQPLAPWSVCNLGAINLAHFVNKKTHKVLFDKLKNTVRIAIRLQDNVVDFTPYFLEKNRIQALGERRIGLGIMGLHDLLLYSLKVYGSKEGNELINKVMETICVTAYESSIELAKQKSSFPFLLDREKFIKSKFIQNLPKHIQNDIITYGIRNSHLLTIAPTGTTGTMVNVSTGLEPYFTLESYYRSGRLGENIEILQPIAQEIADLNPKLSRPELKKLLVGSQDLSTKQHSDVQIIVQRWVDSSISKTVNANSDCTVQQVGDIYMNLYKNNAKGGTVYVDGSRNEQVLSIKGDVAVANKQTQLANLAFINTNQEETNKAYRGVRQDRRIGYEAGDLCNNCKEGTIRIQGGCATCDNCKGQFKCELGS